MQMKRLLLTYSFEHHDFSGHIFEVLDYFIYMVQNGIKPFVYIPFFNKRELRSIIHSRYNKQIIALVSEYEYLFVDLTTKILKPVIDLTDFDIVLSTNGGLTYSRKHKVLVKTFIGFRCNKQFDSSILAVDKIVLQDDRIYESQWKDYTSYHYIKKILFQGIAFKKDFKFVYCAYCVGTQKYIGHPILEFLPNTLIIGKHMIPPINNLFGLFKVFLVTPTKRHFDCSPRLIKECQYFEKDIVFLTKPDFATFIRFKDAIEEVDLRNDDFILDFIGSFL
jgi:hypothetical protein